MFVEKICDAGFIKLGAHLGDLTSEIPHGFKCVKAVFLGPKTYALILVAEDGRTITIIKAKGITLCNETESIITPEAMLDMAVRFCKKRRSDNHSAEDTAKRAPDALYIPQRLFVTDKGTQNVYTRNINKEFRVVSDKRVVLPSNDTRAFGCCKDASLLPQHQIE